eukprot:1194714-Prorocentrum_minimum.AAC.3
MDKFVDWVRIGLPQDIWCNASCYFKNNTWQVLERKQRVVQLTENRFPDTCAFASSSCRKRSSERNTLSRPRTHGEHVMRLTKQQSCIRSSQLLSIAPCASLQRALALSFGSFLRPLCSTSSVRFQLLAIYTYGVYIKSLVLESVLDPWGKEAFPVDDTYNATHKELLHHASSRSHAHGRQPYTPGFEGGNALSLLNTSR